jgi:hypothetical protein
VYDREPVRADTTPMAKPKLRVSKATTAWEPLCPGVVASPTSQRLS